jgi:hypothetical protein
MSEKTGVNDVFKAAYEGFFAKKTIEEIVTERSSSISDEEILDASFPIVKESPGDIV